MTRKVLLVLLIVLCFTLSAFGKTTILCIGIDYGASKTIPHLEGCQASANEMAVCLDTIMRNRGEDVQTILMNDALKSSSQFFPTKTNILNAIANLSLSEDDRFIMYFDGHGEFLDSWECDILTAFDGDKDYEIFTDTELLGILENLPCNTILILDSCHSGGFAEVACNSTKVAVMAASSAMEESRYGKVTTDSGSWQIHSFFTYELLRTLGWSHNKTLTTWNIDGKNVRINGEVVSIYNIEGTVAQLFEQVMESWGRDYQTPQINSLAYSLTF